MMSSLELKVGQLQGRLDAVEGDLKEIKVATTEISDALTKGKGVLIGLILTASGLGAMFSEAIKRWSN